MKQLNFQRIILCVSSSVLLAMTSHSMAAPKQALGAAQPSFGAANSVTTNDLPPGLLRRQLEQLPEQARANAEKWLNSIHFHAQDVPYMRADRDGGIFFADTKLPAMTESSSDSLISSSDTTLASSADVFKLHSNPQAEKIIYLDFDGHAISNTAWNSSVDTFSALPYDVDGDSATFNSDERAYIASIWRRIAEDYAPFNVDVTTEEPAQFGSTTGRLLITKSVDLYGNLMPAYQAGGVAYVNVWGRTDYPYYSPALVYYDNLGASRPDNIAEATSHEMGHNMGLSHDGTSTQSYYGGHGSGAISWGPIMGVGYGRNVTQWSKGEYADANQTEDDIAVINSKVGALNDDHGDQTSTATPLVVDDAGNVLATSLLTDPNQVDTANSGIIASRDDIDVFSFSTTGGTVTLQASPAQEATYTLGGNLDLQLALYDSTGVQLASSDPADNTDAGVSTSVASGSYYVTVQGMGSVNYSDYGSLGRYIIEGELPVSQDTTAPSPNPMGWSLPPQADDYQSIRMSALNAVDESGSEVLYYFTCTAGGAGCVDSGWVSETDYALSGLDAETTYSFSVKAKDAAGNETQASSIASVTTPIAPVINQAPLAVNDVASVAQRSSVTIAVLANDSDPEGDTLSVSGVTQGNKGSVSTDGQTVTYTSGKRKGGDSFSYTISDGQGNTATAQVDVSIVSSQTKEKGNGGNNGKGNGRNK